MRFCVRCNGPQAQSSFGGDICDACSLESVLQSDTANSAEQFGQYEIICELGEGGAAVVYLAEQTKPFRREVALKVVKTGLADREMLARFNTERETLALLSHPHIARAIDAGTSSAGRPYFVMEYVDGHPVTRYCELRRLDSGSRLKLFIAICRALEYAHARGVLHRDIKPSNILIEESSGAPAPKIIDFGIAKALGHRLAGQNFRTDAGELLGTIEYMSPEQADLAHDRLDARSDVYSLGVMLFELLSGTLPVDPERLRAAGLAGALNILINEELPPIASRCPSIPGDLAAIVHTALARDVNRRYSSAAALADDIERYQDNQPVRARPPGFFYRTGKLIRRRASPAILFAAILLTAIALAAVTLTLALHKPSGDVPPVPKINQLTAYNGYQFDPALSPDGRQLAFVWNGDANNYDIYVKPVDLKPVDVKPVDAGDPVRLTRDRDHDLHPAWSPDGRRIAFLRVEPRKKELRIIDLLSREDRRIREIYPAGGAWQAEASVINRMPGPAWSPDGKYIAIANRERDEGPDAIYLVSAETGEQRRLTSPGPDTVGDSLPAFSPDSRELAFVRTETQRGVTDVFIVPLNGGAPRRLTHDGRTISGLAWATTGRIYFNSNRKVGNRLWSISVNGGEPELIPIPAQNVSRVSAATALRRLVVTESFGNSNIRRVDLSRRNAPAEKLISGTRGNDSAKYSPDGTRIVFGSDRSGTYQLWLADADGLHARQITSFDEMPVGSPHWSPDGTQLVFDAGKDGRSVIYTLNVAGGSPRLFLEDDWDNMMPSWSSDGRFIYYASRRNGVIRVWKKPVNGGTAVQITHLMGGEAVEAPQGGTIYFSDGRNGIWQVAPDGGDEKPAPGLGQVRDSRYFAATRRGLYFLANDSRPWVIQFLDFASGRMQPVARIEKEILYQMPCLSVSPDDHWLVYSELDNSGNDILMVEDFR